MQNTIEEGGALKSKIDVLEKGKKQNSQREKELHRLAGKAGRGKDHALRAVRRQGKHRVINSSLYFLKVLSGCSVGQIKAGKRKAKSSLL